METALVGAVIAAGAAIVAAVVSWFGAFQSRRAADRDHAWRRLTWAIRRTETQSEYDISRTVLERLTTVRWAPKPDQTLARRALRRHQYEPVCDREPEAD
ncbi:hypothetical protein GCM10017714_06930 [Curtobacterium pusillum]|uniref:Uncharacterized protein n=1 Tax=Curtobacterium pusillum TaxID=69373 RepID=A0AAW3T6D4_9MICO|nr:hypothetical protein [Curtobacterium pusillum]MBA8990485.1 hypothetical protein [Curtobacterium pusillum]NUU14212.1 hypothetical protein [Curtobacterium pusillum]GLK29956.1 hypothetical protein GCM10017610_02410 [Curtobacterium pusillum]